MSLDMEFVEALAKKLPTGSNSMAGEKFCAEFMKDIHGFNASVERLSHYGYVRVLEDEAHNRYYGLTQSGWKLYFERGGVA